LMPLEVTVVGAGAAGLMAAQVLAEGGAKVVIIDHMKSPARKFLLAGRGGLNLTHSEPLDLFLTRYGSARAKLGSAIQAFAPIDVMDWARRLGIETFTGSSGRIFPKQMKASPLLRAWLRHLDQLGVRLETRLEWQGDVRSRTILAMGGASWPQLGSNAAWVQKLRDLRVDVKPFRPSSVRFAVPWSSHIAEKFAGTPLKNIRLAYRERFARGEVVISRDGIEGGAIYALSAIMRDDPGAPLFIDLKPDISEAAVAERLQAPRGKNTLSNFLRKAVALSPIAIALLHEARQPITAPLIKALPVKVGAPMGLDRAISSAGGVSLDEVDRHFQFIKLPGCYAVGEMLDWEAPTGGYLLQACFSTAVAAARHCLLNEQYV
jgi:uncharacterized flavoprotein (TIGR03862 family)